MPRITPRKWEELDSELQDLMERAHATHAITDDTTTPRLWAVRPELAKAELALHTRFHDSNILEPRLLELVRLRIAAINNCQACSVARKTDEVTEEDVACLSADDPRFTPREQAAIQFAELFAADHHAIDDAFMLRLASWFADEELVELAMYCGTMLAGGRFAHVMRGWRDDDQPLIVRERMAAGAARHP